MASITHKFILNDTVREDGTRLVMLRMTYDRKHRYTGTGVHVAEKHWNPKGDVTKLNWVRSSHGESVQLNLILKGWNARLLTAKEKLEAPGAAAFSVDDVKRRVENLNDGSVSQLIEAARDTYRERKQSGSAHNLKSLLANLRNFLGLKDEQPVLFSHLNRASLERFETYLMTRPMKRRSTPAKRRNTATANLSMLRRYLTQYVVANKLADSDHPMRGWELPTENVEAPSLTEGELIDLLNLKCAPNPRRRVYGDEAVRDFYVCSFGLQGMRVGDLMQTTCSSLQTTKGKLWLYYVSDKKNQSKHLQVQEPFASILKRYAMGKGPNDYLFPFIDPDKFSHLDGEDRLHYLQGRISSINARFRDVAALVGITRHVTLHSARHSFGDALMEQTNDLRLLQAALGHADFQTTERYAARRKAGRTNAANVVYDRFSQQATSDPNKQNNTETIAGNRREVSTRKRGGETR